VGKKTGGEVHHDLTLELQKYIILKKCKVVQNSQEWPTQKGYSLRKANAITSYCQKESRMFEDVMGADVV
jgi:hypothetical protein